MESGTEDTGKTAKILLVSEREWQMSSGDQVHKISKIQRFKAFFPCSRFESRFFKNTFNGIGN